MKKALWMLLASLWIGFGCAAVNDVAFAGTMNYSVKANIPENQINKNLTYFDLKMSPGSKQTLSLTVKNGSDQPIELTIEPNTAVTNQNGVIDYSKHEHEKDSSLKHAFSELISPTQKVTLKGKETKVVPFTIQMPEEPFDGVILGGFYIFKTSQEDESEAGNQMHVKNEFSYVIGVKLSETDKTVEPNLKLNEVKSGLMNYRPVVTANLQNTEPVIVNNLEIDARITKEGKQETLIEARKTQMSMAPNSNFDFPIRWEGGRIEPGKYHLYITATNGKQTWAFDKMFEVKGEEAKQINENAVASSMTNHNNDGKYMLVFLGMGAIIAILAFIIVLLLRKKRGEENEKVEQIISSS